MKIIEVKNCFNECKACHRENEVEYAIIFDGYILTICKQCLEELRTLLNEGGE